MWTSEFDDVDSRRSLSILADVFSVEPIAFDPEADIDVDMPELLPVSEGQLLIEPEASMLSEFELSIMTSAASPSPELTLAMPDFSVMSAIGTVAERTLLGH